MKNRSIENLVPVLLLLVLISISACNNPGKKKSDSNDSKQLSDKQNDIVYKRGLEVYNNVCGICHQGDGSGVPMMFPPLTKSELISGDHEKLIRVILEGMTGPVDINGEQYDNIMPPQNDLTDQEISDLLTWLRNSFGNSGDAISPEEVAKYR